MKRKMWKRLASLALATVLTVGLVPGAQAVEVDLNGGELELSSSTTYSGGRYHVTYEADLTISDEMVAIVNANNQDSDKLESLRFTCYLEDELLANGLTQSQLNSATLTINTQSGGAAIFQEVSGGRAKTSKGASVTYELTDDVINSLAAADEALEISEILQPEMTMTISATLMEDDVWDAIGSANSVSTEGYVLLTYKDGNTIPGFNKTELCLAQDTSEMNISPTASGGSSSGSGGGTSKPTYPVEPVDTSNGEVKTTPTRASKGTVVTITVTPDFGYELAALSVIDEDGNELKLTDKGDGKYTFVMPDGEVTVKASFAEIEEQPSDLPFVDVESNSWYSDAVEYVYENDLMNGTSATTFSPFVTTSRAMILTILARYDGVDTSTGSTWYEAGAAWAVENGVSDGTNLQADLTREQLVTMLWRYLGSPASEGDLSAYPDSAAVSDWAVDAMIWAVNNQVITGNGVGALNPQGTATRAEMAIILMRVLSEK